MVRAGESWDCIMALQFDSWRQTGLGVIRCVRDREGDVSEPGFVDRSHLHLVEAESPYAAEICPPLEIAGTEAVVSGLDEYADRQFLGLEDPTVWRSRESGQMHLYATIPLRDPDSGDVRIYLGHASGDDLHSLRMDAPVLEPQPGVHSGAKEAVIAPRSTAGHRYNLVESSDSIGDTSYSVLRTAIARDPGDSWEYDDLVFHPAHDGYEWCGGHASPGPLLPQSFVDVGDGKRLGLLNGREPNRRDGDTVRFGMFSTGLMVYDYETGRIEWVSEDPLIRDPAADSVTFASAFRQIEADRGLVYAHVDDCAVRVYQIDAESLSSYLP